MKGRLFLTLTLLLALVYGAGAQQVPEKVAWDVSLAPGAKATSNLSVVNQCRKAHRFSVTTENLFFLRFLGSTEVKVSGGRTAEMPVEFDTTGLMAGSYEGALVIKCLTCKSEATCTQDQERLLVKLRVGEPGATQPAQTTQPPTISRTPATGTGRSTTGQPPSTQTPPANRTLDFTGGTKTEAVRPAVHADVDRAREMVKIFGGGGTAPPNPCDEWKRTCEELRRIAWEKEAAAAAAKAAADAAGTSAAELERAAREAEEAAKKAAEAAKDPDEGPGRIVDRERGRVYTHRDFERMREAQRQLSRDYIEKKITEEEYNRRWEEVSSLDGFDRAQDEERRQLAKLKYEAEGAAQKAAEARAAANAAQATAGAAQKAAEEARQEAARARAAYEECLKRAEEECEKERREEERREAERKANEEAARRAAEEAARNEQQAEEQARAERAAQLERERQERERRQQEQKATEERRRTERAQLDYLLSNIRELGLIPYPGWRNTPGVWDWLPVYLQTPVGAAAEEVAQSPIPADVITAIGGLYNIINNLLDPCTTEGSSRTVLRLRKRINPKTNDNYTMADAVEKTGKMCHLLRELKTRVEQQHRGK